MRDQYFNCTLALISDLTSIEKRKHVEFRHVEFFFNRKIKDALNSFNPSSLTSYNQCNYYGNLL